MKKILSVVLALALLLALACLFLLWIGVAHHVIGFGANY